MKTYILTAIAALAMTASSFAQGVHIGIKGGANLFNVYNDNGANYDYKFGFHAGLLTHIHITKHFAIQPEVFYSRQGAKFDYTNGTTNVYSRLNLDYINVPVLFQYMFGNGIRLEAGPQIGFLANSVVRNGDNYYTNTGTFNTVEIAAAAGISYVSPVGLGVDARYVHGFTDITDGGAKSTNRGFQLGLFYLFNHR
jgi:hypothetical protein